MGRRSLCAVQHFPPRVAPSGRAWFLGATLQAPAILPFVTPSFFPAGFPPSKRHLCRGLFCEWGGAPAQFSAFRRGGGLSRDGFWGERSSPPSDILPFSATLPLSNRVPKNCGPCTWGFLCVNRTALPALGSAPHARGATPSVLVSALSAKGCSPEALFWGSDHPPAILPFVGPPLLRQCAPKQTFPFAGARRVQQKFNSC